jgi:anti-sigma regulatory factor (Ser/Thr protein kinase)
MSGPGGTVMGAGRPMSMPVRATARHQALLYHGPADFTATVGSFIRAGLAAGEQVLVVLPAGRLGWLRPEPWASDQAVRLADAADFYATLGRATRTLADWLRAQVRAGRRARVVAEQDLTGQARPDILAYMRAEAAANVVYQAFPLSLLCPFRAALPEPVLADVRRTHPELLAAGRVAASPSFADPGPFIRERSVVSCPPLSAASIGFGSPGDLSGVRRFLRARLATAGLGAGAVQAMITAVGEVVTNALVHGRAPQRLWVYPEGAYLVCHVHDSGPGFADPLAAYQIPGPQALHGHGLWLARQIADAMDGASDQTGTHVRVMARHGAASPPPGAPRRATVP